MIVIPLLRPLLWPWDHLTLITGDTRGPTGYDLMYVGASFVSILSRTTLAEDFDPRHK